MEEVAFGGNTLKFGWFLKAWEILMKFGYLLPARSWGPQSRFSRDLLYWIVEVPECRASNKLPTHNHQILFWFFVFPKCLFTFGVCSTSSRPKENTPTKQTWIKLNHSSRTNNTRQLATYNKFRFLFNSSFLSFECFLLILKKPRVSRKNTHTHTPIHPPLRTTPPFVVFVAGGPGCGKGTQCAKLRVARWVEVEVVEAGRGAWGVQKAWGILGAWGGWGLLFGGGCLRAFVWGGCLRAFVGDSIWFQWALYQLMYVNDDVELGMSTSWLRIMMYVLSYDAYVFLLFLRSTWHLGFWMTSVTCFAATPKFGGPGLFFHGSRNPRKTINFAWTKWKTQIENSPPPQKKENNAWNIYMQIQRKMKTNWFPTFSPILFILPPQKRLAAQGRV